MIFVRIVCLSMCDYRITHVFLCINSCGVLRKLFEHEVDRPSIQTSPEGPGKC